MESGDEEERHPALVELGKQIRKIRKERGFSQEDFAAQAGLGRSYYGGIERGERNVAALNLMRIASTLGVEVGQLFPPKSDFENFLKDEP
jgi:transcriptional regulator with XRE-family HTH domain